MNLKSLFQLPPLDVPEGVPADHVEAWKSPDGAFLLSNRYSAAFDAANGSERPRARKLKELAHKAAYYLTYRSKAQQAQETIQADTNETAAVLNDRDAALQQAMNGHQAAVEKHAAIAAKIQRLVDQLAAAPVPDGVALAAARAAFDQAMVGGNDKAQHAAAVAVHKAEAEDTAQRAEAIRARGPLELVLRAQRDIEAEHLEAIEAEKVKVEEAREGVREALARQAIVAYDKAIYHAASAWAEAWTAVMQTSSRTFPLGFERPVFMFTSRRRSMVRGSHVSNDHGPDSPIVIERETISALMHDGVMPDLTPFVGVASSSEA